MNGSRRGRVWSGTSGQSEHADDQLQGPNPSALGRLGPGDYTSGWIHALRLVCTPVRKVSYYSLSSKEERRGIGSERKEKEEVFFVFLRLAICMRHHTESIILLYVCRRMTQSAVPITLRQVSPRGFFLRFRPLSQGTRTLGCLRPMQYPRSEGDLSKDLPIFCLTKLFRTFYLEER